MPHQTLHYMPTNKLWALGTVHDVGDGTWLLAVNWSDQRPGHTSFHPTPGPALEKGRALIMQGHSCGVACIDWKEHSL
jgi:hypothetical protein